MMIFGRGFKVKVGFYLMSYVEGVFFWVCVDTYLKDVYYFGELVINVRLLWLAGYCYMSE